MSSKISECFVSLMQESPSIEFNAYLTETNMSRVAGFTDCRRVFRLGSMDCTLGLEIRDDFYNDSVSGCRDKYCGMIQTSGSLSFPNDQPIAHLRVWPCINSVKA